MALNEFEGTVMLVSHDRALLRAVCDEFWLVARGGIQPFDGDLDDYQRYLLDEARRQREALRQQSAAAAAPAPAPAAQRRQPQHDLRPLKRQIEQLDRSMGALHAQQAQLQERLLQPVDNAEMAELGRRLKQIGEELAAQEEQWLALSEQLEAQQKE